MARAKLTSEERKALEQYRQLVKANPSAITGDMGTALFRNLPAKTRDKIKTHFSEGEKKSYNTWIKQYKALPADQQVTTGQTPTAAAPSPAQLGQNRQNAIDLSIPGAPERTGEMVSALTDPWINQQREELLRWYDQQDRLNRPNIYGPLGQTTYDYDPATGRFQQKTVADPAQQALLDEETARDTQAAQAARGYLDTVSRNSNLDYAGDRQRATDAVYQQWLKVNEPAMQKQMQDFEQSMANRGIVPGSEQYNREKDFLLKSQQDQRDSALVAAQGQGREEQIHALEMSQSRPAEIAGKLLAMGKGPQLPEAPTPTNVDTNFVNTLDTAFKGVEQILQSDQFTAKLDQDAKELARRFKLDEYEVKETLKMEYKRILAQQAIAQISANAQLGSASIAADASRYATDVGADTEIAINQQNIDADANAINSQNNGGGGSSAAENFGVGAIDGVGAGTGPTKAATRTYGTDRETAYWNRNASEISRLKLPTGQQASILPQNQQQPTQQKAPAQGTSNVGFARQNSVFNPVGRRYFT